MSTYAISDIHGNNDKFNNLLDKLSLNKTDKLFLLGDYVDRGPDSKGVIDTIFNLKNSGYNLTCLRGNHEQMMIDAVNGFDIDFWLRYGGKETLQSFGTELISDIPEIYINFINSLDYCSTHNNFILVHAGVNMRSEEPLEDRESLIWLRNWERYFDKNWLGDRIIIHGHTPMERTRITSRANLIKVICIDNGSYMKDKAEFGNLTALKLETMEFVFA